MSKNILITGASAGLGKATAKYFSQNGYTVYGTSRNPENQTDTSIHWLALDLSDSDSVKALAQHFVSSDITLDALINNAGTGLVASVIDTNREDWQQIFETNLFGPLQLIRLIYPQLKKSNRAAIINIGSVAAEFGLPYRGAYSAVKSALSIATESLALELKSKNMDVYIMHPGDFASNINNNRIVVKDIHPDFQGHHDGIHQLINEHVSEGMEPDLLAKRLFDLVNNRPKKFKHTLAPSLQKVSAKLKQILPYSYFQKLLLNHYKLNS
jgi:NAD(P)-dependent dehydrogenase (short-subunit alcohol dehydrogenase family)